MCGICGYISDKNGPRIQEKTLREMTDTLVHRGPDDKGFFIKEKVGLGHRRLSIIDLNSGQQPIHNEDKSIWIVFNGEIYNFKNLRQELINKSHHFYTKTDTETIVHAYEEWGEQCLQHFNGMFAFALYDQSRQCLFLARDRIGIKPLYYSHVGGQLIFGSELKALFKHPSIKKDVDLDSLHKYLTLEYVPCPNSIIKGINKLLPGHYLIFQKGKLRDECYWDLNSIPQVDPNISEKECIERLQHLIKKSVRRRLIADVPLGAFLSGGVDSSSVVAFMSENSPSNVHTFSIGFDEQSFDESTHALRVSQHFGTRHHEERLSPANMIDLIPYVSKIIDEPLGDASIVPTSLLSSFTRKYVKVALSGDGGDELFGGYPTYQAHRFARYFKVIPKFIREGILGRLVNHLPVNDDNISLDFKAKRFMAGMPFEPEIRHYIWMGSFMPIEKQSLLTRQVKEHINQNDDFEDVLRYAAIFGNFDFINRLLLMDMKLYLQDDILVKLDRASMAASLEARVPLLDHELVEFVVSLPSHMKLHNFTTKYIFKKLMAPILPGKIVNRSKKGFGIPVAKWFKKELKDLLIDTLNPKILKEDGLFEPSYVTKLIEEHCSGRKDNRKLLWTLFVFQQWRIAYLN